MAVNRIKAIVDVSTHRRLKAAGEFKPCHKQFTAVSTHSRLKAAGNVE